MPIRNPFRRAPGGEVIDDAQRSAAERGFQNTAVAGAKPIQIKEPPEYKLSGMWCSELHTVPRAPHIVNSGASIDANLC
jgi:hypothetical protein